MALKLSDWIPNVEKLTRWAEGIKSGSVTLLALVTASVSGIGFMHVVTSDSVSLDSIKVPVPFEEQGFTSEIATTRLLDEITTYQRRSGAAKDRIAFKGKGADDLEKLQATVAGVDVKNIQGIAQDLLGVKRERITGDIIFKKVGDDTIYNSRLRRVPENQVLVDITVKGDPETVLKQTALALIEALDPHIAASIYWRNRDEKNTMRMINVVLGNDNPADDKYSLNLRGYIHITHKRFDKAAADFNRIMKIDPNFAPAYVMNAWLLRGKGQLEASLGEADKAIELAPSKYFGYFQKALTQREMKRDDEADANFGKALSLIPDAPMPFVRAATFKMEKGKQADAEEIYHKGLYRFPYFAPLHVGLADLLRAQGQVDRALREYSEALELDPMNDAAITGKKELEHPRN